MECILKKINEEPFLYSKNSIVNEVNDEFINLTGYSNNELMGKSLSEISNMLRIDSQVYLENIENEHSCYIFTKEFEPIEITISCKSLNNKNEKMYFIKNNTNSSVKESFDFVKQVYTDGKSGFAIISVPDLILLKANDNYLNNFDEPYNKIYNSIGKKYKEIIVGYEGSESEEIWNSVMTTGEPAYVEEFQHNYFKRGVTYWNLAIVPIFIEGKLKYIINKMLDVTERVLNGKNLLEQVKIIKEQKKQLEVIIENISDQVVFINKNGNYTNMNKASKSNPLYDFTTLKNNKTTFEQVKHFDIDGNLILYENTPEQRVIRGDKISEYIVFVNNENANTYTEATGTPIYNEEGDFIGGVMIYRDMTEQLKKQENRLLKIQYKSLQTIMENLDFGCTITSYPNLNINYINNKSYIKLKKIDSQIELSNIMGGNIFDIFKYNIPEKTKAENKIKSLIEKRSNSCFYYKKSIELGKEEFLKIICQPISGLNNEVVELIFITIDITEEIEARNKMERTLKTQDEMFSNISHELKTPLNVIFSTNQLMEFYLKNDSFEANSKKVFNGINIIKQNCYRLTRLVNNVIDVSRVESGFLELNLSNQNIVNIIEDIVQSISDYIKTKELNIIFDTNTEEKIIACDPSKIERIMLNLISNAIKFTNATGSIFVNILDTGDTVEISVKDTGAGMDKKHLNDIFKRFHQVDKSLSRKTEGSGIGLSLVKSMVELHGGKISVKSKPDEGSIFKIELPARTIENSKVIEVNKFMNSKIETINIEFSDIYSI